MQITSLQNPHIKNCVRLHSRKERDRQRKLLVEGYRAILRALQNGYPLDAIYYCPALFFGDNETALLALADAAGVALYAVAEEPFCKMAARPRPDGLLAIGPQRSRPLHTHHPGPDGFLLVAEGIEKPANLGSMIRAADGAGVDALVVCASRTDVFHPDVVRASVGTFFTLPLLTAEPQETVQWCRTHGIVTVAATPQATTLYTDVDLRGPVAVVVGNEQVGLSEAWLAGADCRVKLPMFGQIDSLNVAVAAALLLYETVRQRQGQTARTPTGALLAD